MSEENFPPRSPTRDAVEREMSEPANLVGSTGKHPRRIPRAHLPGPDEPNAKLPNETERVKDETP